jgi:hypothetical protein
VLVCSKVVDVVLCSVIVLLITCLHFELVDNHGSGLSVSYLIVFMVDQDSLNSCLLLWLLVSVRLSTVLLTFSGYGFNCLL